MPLSKIISYISLFIWLLPPLKQFRGRFFYYFLIQAISDPVAMVLVYFGLHSMPFYVLKDVILALAVWKPKYINRKLFFLLPILIIIFFVLDLFYYKTLAFIISLILLVILYLFFKIAVEDQLDRQEIKLFYILLIFYELTVLLKFIFLIASIDLGLVYYYMTTAFEILLGVFFSFVSERSTRFAIAIPERKKAAE